MGIARQQEKWGIAMADFNGSQYGSEYLHLQAGEQLFISPASSEIIDGSMFGQIDWENTGGFHSLMCAREMDVQSDRRMQCHHAS